MTALAVALLGVAPVAAAPNVIVVVTDDQRSDDLFAMPVLTGMLAESVEFTNAFVTTAECAPSRASLLSGRYAHSHGVRTLDGTPFVGPDAETVAVWLRRRHYRTAMVGKYINEYARLGPPARATWYVPPGWDVWRAFRAEAYYDYSIVDEHGVETAHGSAPEDYSTDVLRDLAIEFLRDSLAHHRRFFLYVAPFAPHDVLPGLDPPPAPRHVDALAGIAPLRPPSFMEADVSDKPPETYLWWLGPEFLDEHRIRRLETLLAVDDLLGAILTTLRHFRVERHTVVVYTSDNGYLLGEHRLLGKPYPYEEAHRVPLVVFDPHRIHAPRRDDHLVVNEDVAPTVAALTHAVPSPFVDGRSLAGLLHRNPADWRTSIPLESWETDGALEYRGVRTARWSYDQRASGDEELYDLAADPYELANAAGDSGDAAFLDDARELTSELHAGD